MPSADVIVRPAQAGEGELLGTIGFNAWGQGIISTAGGPDVDREHVKAQFMDFCLTGYGTILVAELDGRPVGWGAREHRDNNVTDLWVSPEAQGLGVGRVLLEALENDIARAGYSTAELETAAVNAGGIRFYERAGYALVWRQVKFSRGLGKEVEKVGLAKLLEPLRDRRAKDEEQRPAGTVVTVLPLIRPSGTFSHKGRRPRSRELSVGIPSPLAGEGGAQRRMRRPSVGTGSSELRLRDRV